MYKGRYSLQRVIFNGGIDEMSGFFVFILLIYIFCVVVCCRGERGGRERLLWGTCKMMTYCAVVEWELTDGGGVGLVSPGHCGGPFFCRTCLVRPRVGRQVLSRLNRFRSTEQRQPCRDCRCLSGRAGTDYCRGGAMYQSSKPLPSAFTDVPNMYRPSADMYSMTPPGMMIP